MSKQKASTRNHPITPDPVIPAKAGISDDNTTLSSQRLLQLYDRVADAPDAVERLRKFVLDLAVRGKLVEQNDGDEPAKELLTRIKNEKEKLFKAGAIRKPKELPPIEEVPFEVPSNWEWARMREVTSDRGQKVPDRTFTYIDVSAINKEAGGVAEPRVLKKDEAPSRARKITAIDDVIYSCVRPYLLNVAVIDQEFEPEPIVSTAFAVLNGHGLVLPWYLWITLRSPFMIEQVEKNQRGQAYPAINDKDFSLLPFPLSPLAEQHRIVAKVDELMALLGRLETTRTKRETTRDRLTTASLSRLTAPDTTEKEFPNHARFALDNLHELTTCPDQIKGLRQTILNLAVRGKLVEQEILDRAAEPGLNKRKVLDDSDEPFHLPSAWSWVSVDSVATTRLGKMLDKAKNRGRPRPYLRNINVRWFDFDVSNLHEMLFEDLELEEYSLRRGDVLICEGGEPGRAAVWDERIAEIYFQKAIHRVRFTSRVEPHFFVLCLKASADDGRLAEYFTGTGIKHFTGKGLRSYRFPLPPFSEQSRIIAKVEVLMALCNQLEAVLTTTDVNSESLLEAVLYEALNATEPPERRS